MSNTIKVTFEIDRDFIRGIAALSGAASNAKEKEQLKQIIELMDEITITDNSEIMKDKDFAEMNFAIAAIALAAAAKEMEDNQERN